MLETVLRAPTFPTFLIASFILAITPGPGVIYVVTRTLTQGRNAGLASLGGLALGNLGNAALASVGLAAVFAASAAAFTVVRLAGALYLIFLALKALRSAPADPTAAPTRRESPGRLSRDAFFVALLNPKTALFFAALLPQFIEPGAAPLGQSLILGALFVAMALCTDAIYVFSAAALAPSLRLRSSWRTWGRFVPAASFLGLGLYAAFADVRLAK